MLIIEHLISFYEFHIDLSRNYEFKPTCVFIILKTMHFKRIKLQEIKLLSTKKRERWTRRQAFAHENTSMNSTKNNKV